MNKYQRLISKIELFQKLALYGDRSAFLKEIMAEEDQKEEKKETNNE